MKQLYSECWVVTCDDVGTEHEAGWMLVENGAIVSLGSGVEPETDERIDLGGDVVGFGARRLYDELGVASMEGLKDAAGGERIRALNERTETPLAMALRGRFLVGSRPVGGEFVSRFVASAAASRPAITWRKVTTSRAALTQASAASSSTWPPWVSQLP